MRRDINARTSFVVAMATSILVTCAFSALALAELTAPFKNERGAIDSDGKHCRRGIEFSSLKPELQEKLRSNETIQVNREAKEGGTEYYMGYIYSLNKDTQPDLIMAVYSRVHEHAGSNGLGDFILQSLVLDKNPAYPSNPFKVYYEQQVDWPYNNGEYVDEDRVISDGKGGYTLEAKLVETSNAGMSPRWADAYLSVTPQDGGSFVVACNYMVPHTDSFSSLFNKKAKERLGLSAKNLKSWIDRVKDLSQDKQKEYLSRLKDIVGKN